MLHPASIGPYPVVRQLGAGGMGVVYLVTDPQLGRQLALKLVREKGSSRTAHQRFWREAAAMAQVRHPGVIKVHKVDRAPEGQFILEEYVEGETLDDLIERGPPAFEATTRIVRDLADAVEAVHAQGILHRDIKPANVVIRADTGKPMLLDFGLAREVDAETLTKTGQVIGTPAYMSPEQARGTSSKQLTPAVDVYALGCLLYALLTGDVPFHGGNTFVLLRMIMAKEPDWPRELNPEVPEGLDAICRIAMAKAPADRYPTAAAMREDLDALLRGDMPAAKRKARARVPVLAVASALVLVATLLAAAVWSSSTARVDAPPRADRRPRVTTPRPAPSATPTETEKPQPGPLWTLAPGDTFTILWHYKESDGQRIFELDAEMPTRVVGPHEGEPGRLTVETSIAWMSARFGFLQGGMAAPYDTRSPSPGHPLENLDVAVGHPFTFRLTPETGHVSNVAGLTSIYKKMEKKGFAGSQAEGLTGDEPLGADLFPERLLANSTRFFFSKAFHNRFLRQCFDAVLHLGGGPCNQEVVNWTEAKRSPASRTFALEDQGRPGVYPVSAHFLGDNAVRPDGPHVFRLGGSGSYSGGRLVKSTFTQKLLFPSPGPGLGDSIELALSVTNAE